MVSGRISRFLYPDRYLLVLFGFFVLFPFFMDLITPDVIIGYAGGAVNAQGEVVARYHGGTAPQYQWYYPFIYPFMVIWYLAVVGFGILASIIPNNLMIYRTAELVYFYLVAAVLSLLIWNIIASAKPYLSKLTPTRKTESR